MSVLLSSLAKVLFLFPRAVPCRGAVPALALSTLFLFSSALRAQEVPPTTDPPAGPKWVSPEQRKRLSGSGEFAAGTSLWGPVSDIQNAMWDAGLNDPGDGGVLGSQTVTYPRIHDFPDRASFWVAGRQGRRGARWIVGLGAGMTGLGSVEGHRAEPAISEDVYVTVKASLFTIAPMLWFEAAPVLRLGLGPAVHAVDLDPGVSNHPNVDPPDGENPVWRAGLLVEAALTLPAGKPFYFLILGQYRWLAEASVVLPWTAGPPRPVSVPLSHAFVAVGAGFRL